MFNKDSAIAMRKSGMSFKEIAVSIGCSEAWCKKALRGVKKESSTVDCTKLAAIKIMETALAELRTL